MFNKNGKPFTRFCSFSQYHVKAYDKGREISFIGNNILRFEIVHIKTKEIFKKEEITLEDLTDKRIWEHCFNHIINIYNHIRVFVLPGDGINTYSKCLLYSLPIFNKDFRNIVTKRYEDLKNVHNSLKNSGVHLMIKNNLIYKYHELIVK